MELSSRNKRILKWVGYPLLALVTFMFAAAHMFPYGRLKQAIVASLSQRFNTSIASVEPTFFPGGVVIKTIMLQTRPRSTDEKPVSIVIDELDVNVGLFALLRGKVDVDVVADIAGGKIEGAIKYSKAGLVADVDTRSLPLQNLPWIRGAVGLPAHGGLNASIALRLPKLKWSEAKGRVTLSCPGCTVGDGVSKIRMTRDRYGRRNVFGEKGLTVPKLDLGNLSAEMDIKGGVGTIKKFAAKSADGELYISGKIHFRDPVKDSRFPGCMRFRLSSAFQKRQPKFGNIGLLLPARTRQPDGFNALPMHGTLAALRWDPRRRCEAGPGESSARPARPTIRPAPPTSHPVTRAGQSPPTHSGRFAPEVRISPEAARRAAVQSAEAHQVPAHATSSHSAPAHGVAAKPSIPQKPPRRLVITPGHSGTAASRPASEGARRRDDVRGRQGDDVQRQGQGDDVHARSGNDSPDDDRGGDHNREGDAGGGGRGGGY